MKHIIDGLIHVFIYSLLVDNDYEPQIIITNHKKAQINININHKLSTMNHHEPFLDGDGHLIP